MRVDSLWRSMMFVLCAMACSIAFNFPAGAQCERDSAHAPLPADNDWYGNTVAISGDFAAAGWYTASFNGERSGAVVMYQRDAVGGAWEEHSTLVPPDNQAGDGFGTRVAMDGDVLVASSRWDDDNGADAGSAYVYRFDRSSGQWLMEAKLLASDGAPFDDFGYAVALRGDLIAVAASNLNSETAGAEQCYVFRRTDVGHWMEEAILASTQHHVSFGISVSISGQQVLVSAEWHEIDYGTLPNVEWVEVFEVEESSRSWKSIQILTNPFKQDEVAFGFTLASDSSVTLVGSAHTVDGPPFTFMLVAYAFERDFDGRWTFVQMLPTVATPPAVWPVRWLAVDGDNAIIGTTSPLSNNHGIVSLFRREPSTGHWNYVAGLDPSNVTSEANRFGFSVALDGDRVIIGAPEYDSNIGTIDDPGSVYFIDLAGDDCNGNSLCDDLDIASGFSLDGNGNGVPDECETIPGDLNNDGVVDIDDLLALITAWGPCPPPPAACLADIVPAQGDHVVNIDDLLLLLSNWSA